MPEMGYEVAAHSLDGRSWSWVWEPTLTDAIWRLDDLMSRRHRYDRFKLMRRPYPYTETVIT